jgi:hypothetical protein
MLSAICKSFPFLSVIHVIIHTNKQLISAVCQNAALLLSHLITRTKRQVTQLVIEYIKIVLIYPSSGSENASNNKVKAVFTNAYLEALV